MLRKQGAHQRLGAVRMRAHTRCACCCARLNRSYASAKKPMPATTMACAQPVRQVQRRAAQPSAAFSVPMSRQVPDARRALRASRRARSSGRALMWNHDMVAPSSAASRLACDTCAPKAHRGAALPTPLRQRAAALPHDAAAWRRYAARSARARATGSRSDRFAAPRLPAHLGLCRLHALHPLRVGRLLAAGADAHGARAGRGRGGGARVRQAERKAAKREVTTVGLLHHPNNLCGPGHACGICAAAARACQPAGAQRCGRSVQQDALQRVRDGASVALSRKRHHLPCARRVSTPNAQAHAVGACAGCMRSARAQRITAQTALACLDARVALRQRGEGRVRLVVLLAGAHQRDQHVRARVAAAAARASAGAPLALRSALRAARCLATHHASEASNAGMSAASPSVSSSVMSTAPEAAPSCAYVRATSCHPGARYVPPSQVIRAHCIAISGVDRYPMSYAWPPPKVTVRSPQPPWP
jgi:hypothetical protein